MPHNFLVAHNYSELFQSTEKLEVDQLKNIWGRDSITYQGGGMKLKSVPEAFLVRNIITL
jgi:hypothetical protein